MTFKMLWIVPGDSETAVPSCPRYKIPASRNGQRQQDNVVKMLFWGGGTSAAPIAAAICDFFHKPVPRIRQACFVQASRLVLRPAGPQPRGGHP